MDKATLIEKSEKFGALALALAKAQGEFEEVEKNCVARIPMKSGGSYSFEYADLAAIRNATTPALTKYGIALIQAFETVRIAAERDRPARAIIRVQTELLHGESEQWMRTPLLEIEADANDAKAIGGASTYFRRYQVQTLLAIAAEDDTDADGQGQRKENTRSAPPSQQRSAPPRQAPSADKTLEPGEDPPSMQTTDVAATVRAAIAKQDWRTALQTATALPSGPLKASLMEEYRSARHGANGAGKEAHS